MSREMRSLVLIVMLLGALVFAGCGGGGGGGTPDGDDDGNGPAPQQTVISGELTDATGTGEPVTGLVKLMLSGQNTAQGDQDPLDQYQSDDGHYELRTDQEGTFVIVVEPDGGYDGVRVEIGVSGAVEELTVDITLLPGDTTVPDFNVIPSVAREWAYGEQQQFSIDIDGYEPTWSTTGGIGTIDSSGLFTAGQADATGQVIATLGEASASVEVIVRGTQTGTPSADLNDALAVPMPTACSSAAADTLARLTDWESNVDRRPDTDADLRQELGWWVQAATDTPDDPAAQLGLSLTMLAVAGQDGAGALGYDLFDEFGIEEATSLAFDEDVQVENFVEDAMEARSLSGVPSIRGANAPQMDAADTTPGELQDYRAAVQDYLLPAVTNAVQRFAAIGDYGCGGPLLMQYQVEGDNYSMYGADFQALAAGMQLVRCGLLMVTAVNPDYGDYQWDLDLGDRDANDDGVLTPDEYAPPVPFGDINAQDWEAAGAAMRDGVQRLSTAISDGCLPADSDDLVRRALAEQQNTTTAELRDYLADAHTMLSGEVNVTIEYANWEYETGRVYGSVVDADTDGAVQNAQVSIGDQSDSTDFLGSFYLNRVPIGEQTMTVNPPEGYELVPGQDLTCTVVGGERIDAGTIEVRDVSSNTQPPPPPGSEEELQGSPPAPPTMSVSAMTGPAEWVDQGSEQVPLNLGALWDNPPASFRSLLPTLHRVLDWGDYMGPLDSDVEVELRGWDGNNVEYTVYPFMTWENPVSMPIGTGTHTLEVPASLNDTGSALTVVFAEDWSSADVTIEGETLTWSRDMSNDEWYSPFAWLPRWDDAPTELRTVMGIFPNPDQIRDLAMQDYDRYVYRYGHFEFADEPAEWELY